MLTYINTPIIKQVGNNGQISLGKEYAGKQIQISKLADGTILIKSGRFIPDNELWLYRNNNVGKLEEAIIKAENPKRRENFEEIKKKTLGND